MLLQAAGKPHHLTESEAVDVRSRCQVVVRKQADEVKAIADDAQKDLDIAMPALESALDTMSGAMLVNASASCLVVQEVPVPGCARSSSERFQNSWRQQSMAS